MSTYQPINQAMVLAAGYGKRLRPLTDKTPKPLIPIAGRPLLEYTLAELYQAEVGKIVINTHYLATQIHDYLRAYPSVIISHEETLLDTGGGVAKALPYFQDQPFILINADTYWRGTAVTAIAQLKEKWNAASMDALLLLVPRLTHVSVRGDYFLESTGQLIHRDQHDTAPYIYSGLAIIHPRIFEGIPPGPFRIVDVCFHKAQAHGRLYGHVHQGFWADIGTPDSLHALQMLEAQ
jgi:N-acetyl-alpha-D-muramate 1-phosphate uridylyltransferase